ncbi:hypothetical protein [Lysobacter gummosus]|nr:hypothetical protein LG3211_3262 [Lysobacter gummosus]
MHTDGAIFDAGGGAWKISGFYRSRRLRRWVRRFSRSIKFLSEL